MAKPGLPSLMLPARILPEEPKLPPPKSALIAPGKEIVDDRVQGISKRLVVGYSETIGRRKTMEDKLVIFGSYRTKDDEDYFAVFDGHNGYKAAEFCASSLHVRLAQKLENLPDTITCFKETFVESNSCLKSAITEGGTTAVIALFKGEELFIANAGDSRAVLSHKEKARRVTTDHKPVIPEEKERIERAGGYVDHKGTITGSLAVSRSLGDFSYYPFITCEPDVFGPFLVLDKRQEYQLLILACDGLWDVVTDQEAVDIALGSLNPQEAAKKLQETATEKNSKDNISVVVVFFPHYKPGTAHIPLTKETKTTPLKTDSNGKSNGGKKQMIRVSSSKGVTPPEKKPPKRTASIKSTRSKKKEINSSTSSSRSPANSSTSAASTSSSSPGASQSHSSPTSGSSSQANSSRSSPGASSASTSSKSGSSASISKSSSVASSTSSSNSRTSKSGNSGSSSSKSGTSATSGSPKVRQSKTLAHSKVRSTPNPRSNSPSISPTVDRRKDRQNSKGSVESSKSVTSHKDEKASSSKSKDSKEGIPSLDKKSQPKKQKAPTPASSGSSSSIDGSPRIKEKKKTNK